jgi:hypothetical protein
MVAALYSLEGAALYLLEVAALYLMEWMDCRLHDNLSCRQQRDVCLLLCFIFVDFIIVAWEFSRHKMGRSISQQLFLKRLSAGLLWEF